MDQGVSSGCNIDVMALVSYDQVEHSDDTPGALSRQNDISMTLSIRWFPPLHLTLASLTRGANMSIGFTGKRVLVTGGARGIGAATSRAFRDAGAYVVVGASSQSSYDAFVALHGHEGFFPAVGTLVNQATCTAVVGKALAALGGLDILVNSAGIYAETEMAAVTDENWFAMMGVNVAGTFFCCQASLPALEASRGNIVNLGSDAGLVGSADAIPYSAAKGAVVNMTRAMAVRFAERVRVNCVCPGFIWTDMVEHVARASDNFDDYVAAANAHSPMNRIGQPAEVAAAILYLASEAAAFVNGIALPIDGGGVAGY
jgi:NAD(P)-dependent dehydrogenase (short-subunit alcohol dehydrogenase family)